MGHLALTAAGPLLLTTFIRTYGFAKQAVVARQQSQELPFEIAAPLTDEPIGFAPKNLADGWLGDSQLRRDLALRSAGGTQLPHTLRPCLDDGPRFTAAGTAATRTARRRHP